MGPPVLALRTKALQDAVDGTFMKVALPLSYWKHTAVENDIVLLQETRSGIPEGAYDRQQFGIVQQARYDKARAKAGGGVAVLYRKSAVRLLGVLQARDVASTALVCEFHSWVHNQQLVVVNVYMPPANSPTLAAFRSKPSNASGFHACD